MIEHPLWGELRTYIEQLPLFTAKQIAVKKLAWQFYDKLAASRVAAEQQHKAIYEVTDSVRFLKKHLGEKGA